jgi:Zinc finger, C2H2 type
MQSTNFNQDNSGSTEEQLHVSKKSGLNFATGESAASFENSGHVRLVNTPSTGNTNTPPEEESRDCSGSPSNLSSAVRPSETRHGSSTPATASHGEHKRIWEGDAVDSSHEVENPNSQLEQIYLGTQSTNEDNVPPAPTQNTAPTPGHPCDTSQLSSQTQWHGTDSQQYDRHSQYFNGEDSYIPQELYGPAIGIHEFESQNLSPLPGFNSPMQSRAMYAPHSQGLPQQWPPQGQMYPSQPRQPGPMHSPHSQDHSHHSSSQMYPSQSQGSTYPSAGYNQSQGPYGPHRMIYSQPPGLDQSQLSQSSPLPPYGMAPGLDGLSQLLPQPGSNHQPRGPSQYIGPPPLSETSQLDLYNARQSARISDEQRNSQTGPKRTIRQERAIAETKRGNRKYLCDVCGAGFERPSNLVVHQRTHTKEKPYVCCGCGKAFTTASNCNRHSSKLHDSRDLTLHRPGNKEPQVELSPGGRQSSQEIMPLRGATEEWPETFQQRSPDQIPMVSGSQSGTQRSTSSQSNWSDGEQRPNERIEEEDEKDEKDENGRKVRRSRRR